MPTYEFRCNNGHEFEQFHKMSDAPSTAPCPTCGAEAARAISGGAGLVFKGSGFYLTDYGKNAHRGGPAPSGDGKAGGKGDGAASGGEGGAKKEAAPAAGGSTAGAASAGTSAGGAAGASGGTGGGSTVGSTGGGTGGAKKAAE